jgi:type IX secretion system substrate protein
MKSLKLIIIILITGLFTNTNAQHVLGRWVIPTRMDGAVNTTHELAFTDTGITSNTLPLVYPENYPKEISFSGGGYDANYNLQFYILGDHICYLNDPPADWVDGEPLINDFQIINKPDTPNEYYAFYTYVKHSNVFNHVYRQIEMEGGQLVIGDEVDLTDDVGIIGGINGNIGIYITPDESSPRYLYACLPENNAPGSNHRIGGLRKWEITSNGLIYDSYIVEENSQTYPNDLDSYDFDAYNLEHSSYMDGNEEIDVFAWIHAVDNTSTNQDVEELIIVIDGISTKYNLSRGRLGGIEFSKFEQDMIYVSTLTDGLIKVNYTNGQVQSTIHTDFQRTFLQTAPDGHIYGVKNNGRFLGRIYQYEQDGHAAGYFDEEFFEFPTYHKVSSTKEFNSGVPYYILPENSNTWTPLETNVITGNVSCPGYTDGSVEIYVSGGVPPYSITSTPSISFIWDEDDEYFYANNLAQGTYSYTVIDDYGNPFAGTFEIDVDFDGYTHEDHMEFDQNETFSNVTVSFAKGFTVQKGVKITYNNSTILMGPDANVTIEAGVIEEPANGIASENGGELTLNNTTITHHADCNRPWEGIEVLGIRNASQLRYANGHTYQGKLVVENGSVVKNAKKAVVNYHPGNFATSGGIILVSNSTFENNIQSVELMAYENFNSTAPHIKLPYRCEFVKCTFTINDNWLFNQNMEEHVRLYNVHGINFRGCTFKNDNTARPNTGIGINSTNGGFKLVDFSYLGIDYHSEFYNLYEGIDGSNTLGCVNTITVDNAEFINNSIGAYIETVNNISIINSNFEIGYNYESIDSCGYSMGYGIDLRSSIGFAIEENGFTKFTGSPTGYYTGIRIYECESDVDVIYNNSFEGLSYGNYAYGKNRQSISDGKGVKYECNQNTMNNIDFIVTHEDDRTAMVHTNHGTINERASGNTFSTIQDPEINWHFRNEGKQNINWYYCDSNNSCPDQTPTHYMHNCDNGQVCFTPIVAPEYDCPSHYEKEDDIKFSSAKRQQVETEYALSLSDYNNVKALYDNLKDGGNTTGELLDIQTAIPGDMWELRSKLLGDSPHLTEEILKEVADRTDVFPESAIFDILAANPDELKNSSLLEYLKEKEDPLPDYMISLLGQVSNGTTYKTALLQDMYAYHAEKTKVAQDIIRSIVADSIVDYTDYRNWLDNLGTMGADKQIISTYLAQGDTANARIMLDMLPLMYELTGEEMDAYNDYNYLVNLDISLKKEDKNYYQLESQDIATLEWMADSSATEAKSIARNILKFAHGYDYCDCLYVSDAAAQKIAEDEFAGFMNSIGISISCSPNPASNWTEFTYTLPFAAGKGEIVITDITGKFVERIVVTGNQGQKLWDTRKTPNGVYLFTLKSKGYSIAGKIVISN